VTAILGISCFYHDSAAALVRDGDIVAAVQEERFTRVKHDSGFPRHAVAWCLEHAGLAPADLDAVVFYEKPLLKFDRLLETYLAYAPRGFRSFLKAMPQWLRTKLFIPQTIARHLPGLCGPVLMTGHHEAHAASAFYPSPFAEAAVLTVDGVGEWSTAAWGVGRGRELSLRQELRFPHSLGLLYSAVTYFTGFRVNSGEYKVMGLAPYGEPRYLDLLLDHVVELRDDGSLWLDQDYFDYCAGLTMTSDRFAALMGGPPRRSEDPLTQREMDLAASVQRLTEMALLNMARYVHAQTGLRHLCLAGGVALNCVANGRLLREGPFTDLWIQPAAGDAGGALGAALRVWYARYADGRAPQRPDAQHGSYLGPAWDDDAAWAELAALGAVGERFADEAALCNAVADLLAAGKVVGHHHGRLEFGPRALGHRSILGDPRDPAMQRTMNLKIKFRESFRPFAPAVLAEEAGAWFELDRPSPYMLLVAPVRRERWRDDPAAARLAGVERVNAVRSEIPAVTHVDHSARIQTVDREGSPRFRRILEAFRERTGCPVLVNTSFNIRGEPIVNTPAEAYRCFMFTDMDALVVGDRLLLKERQPPLPGAEEYKRRFKPD